MNEKEDQFLGLVKENQGILYKMSRMYMDNPEDREDLEQEIVLQLWKSYDGFKGQSKFSSWMYRVALNTAILFFKKEKKKVATTELDSTIPEQKEPIDNHEEKLSIFYKAARQLTRVERAIVFLYMEGLSHKEVGANLNISEGNARVKLNRTKNKLQLIIKKHEE